MKRISVEVYGCPTNQADYEIIKGFLQNEGYTLVKDPSDSDLNIVCTCVVKQPTEFRMIHIIKELTKLKKPLIVTGCMPKTGKDIIEKIAPEASMLGPDSIQKVVDVVNDTLYGKKVAFLKDLRKPKMCLPRIRRNNIISIVPIATGCLSFCSYCCVRFARGRLFSYPPELIIKEIKASLEQGCKEVWITSQDNGCYGMDMGIRLPQLLEDISKIPGKFFVRVGMLNPTHIKDITKELINAYKSQKIFKFLHLPVQSGSDRILELMDREYMVKDFLKIVNDFRKEFPMLTLSTDIIVGFPGETEKDFRKTVQLIEEIKPDIVNISKYGNRPNTLASRMEQVPRKIINERTKTLSDLVRKLELENNEKWLGWEGEVLIDEYGKKGKMIGRNFAYKPIVTNGKLGSFKNIKIMDIQPTYLIGK